MTMNVGIVFCCLFTGNEYFENMWAYKLQQTIFFWVWKADLSPASFFPETWSNAYIVIKGGVFSEYPNKSSAFNIFFEFDFYESV